MSINTIPEDKWSDIVDLICDIAEASDEGDTRVADEYTFDLHCMLDNLQKSYGLQPLIVSTRADFTDDIGEQISLYEQAIALAEQANDPICILQSTESLAQIYIEELADPAKGAEWLALLKKCVSQYSDEFLCGEIVELEQVLHEIS